MTLFKKELRLNFFRPGYLAVAGSISLYLGIQFFYLLANFSNISQQARQVGGSSLLEHIWAPYFGQVNMILIFICPFFVARLFFEEKRQNTMLNLLSSPLSSLRICTEKYLAGLCLVLFLVLIATLYPLLSLLIIPSFHFPEMFMGVLAISLAACLYSSVALFCGSLFNSSMIAGVVSLMLNLSFWSIGIVFRDLITFESIAWVEHLWIGKHITELFIAKFSLSAIYFFVAGSALFLFLSFQIVDEVERG